MQKLLNKILPSSKLKKDVQFSYNKIEGIKPISIKGMSLITPMKKYILALRKKSSSIKIEKTDAKKLSLIVPYRNREEHLKQFLPYMKDYLEKQNIAYEIIIVEQKDNRPFNRAKLMNIGTLCSAKETHYFSFHDVDLLPINIDYRYSNHTQKLFNYIKKDGKEKKFGESTFGGATLVPKEIFYAINGFANNYWQWGKEDDDFLMRHLLKGFIPLFDTNGYFESLPHQQALLSDIEGKESRDSKILKENKKLYKKNKIKFSKFKRGLSKQEDDGINNIDNYTILSSKEEENVKFIAVVFE